MLHKEIFASAGTVSNPAGIGSPGTLGFGVGVCQDQDALTRLNLSPMEGYDDPSSDNYGNYIHTPTQSVMVYIPAFKYRIGDLPEGDLPTQKWGVNSVQIWSVDDPSCPSNAILHRAFIDGGEQKQGFFCDKFICSPSADKTCGVSIKNKAPLSLTSASSYTPSNQIANCSGQLDDAITASRARGNGFQCMSVFQLGALRLLTLAHAQACTDTSVNAWYDSTGAHNGPHGNTYNLKDYDHPESTWTTGANDGGNANKGLTGSCNVFARSTHNGQNCGIADLKGIVYQVVTGSIGNQYYLKQSEKIGDLEPDMMYDTSRHSQYSDFGSGSWYWGAEIEEFTNDVSGMNWETCGYAPATHSSGSNRDMFEDDYFYCDNGYTNEFPFFGCSWGRGSGSAQGLWYVNVRSAARSDGSSLYGFRACGY